MNSFHSGKRLALARKLHSLRQEEVVGEDGFCRVDVRTLQRWEKVGIPASRIKEVAQFFSLEAWVFLDDSITEKIFQEFVLYPGEQDPLLQKIQQKAFHQNDSENKKSRNEEQNNKKSDNDVFISYAWEEESESIINSLEEALEAKDIKVIRDKQALGYKGEIQEFMKELGKGKCVIVVIGKKYLESENCMFELVQIARNGNFYDRVFPILLEDAQIFEAIPRIKYVNYWEDKYSELEKEMKKVSMANLQGFREDIDRYMEIRNTMPELTNIIRKMNVLSSKIHLESDFHELIQAIKAKLRE